VPIIIILLFLTSCCSTEYCIEKLDTRLGKEYILKTDTLKLNGTEFDTTFVSIYNTDTIHYEDSVLKFVYLRLRDTVRIKAECKDRLVPYEKKVIVKDYNEGYLYLLGGLSMLLALLCVFLLLAK